jgi:polysaccharide biosynthesis protein VpsM
MKIKTLFLAASSFAMLAATPAAFGFAEIARGKLTATAKVAYEYDSNIFASNAEISDNSVIFSPSLNYSRNVGIISSSADLTIRSINFQDSSGQDSIDPSLSLNFNADRAEKGQISQSLSYARSSSANETLNTRAKSDEVRGTTRVDYYFSEKTGYRVNLAYRLSDYLSNGFNSITSYTVGGGMIYKYSPKLTASATYGYSPEKATNLGNNPVSDPSSKNHRFRVGLEGQLAPKISGSVAAGVVYRDFDLGGSTSAFLMSSAVSWTANEKTQVTGSVSNDFDTTPGAESAENFNAGLVLRHTLTEKVTIGASYTYQHAKLNQKPGPVRRTDESNTFGVNAAYRMNENLNLTGSLSHRKNDSTAIRAVYDREIVNLALAYSF